jgi:hypothetical protein
MSLLSELKPKEKERVCDLLEQAGIRVESNRFFLSQCAFRQDDKIVVLNFWYEKQIKQQGENIVIQLSLPTGSKPSSYRARTVRDAIKSAIENNLKIRIIVLDGKMAAKNSKVSKRSLDPMPWSVKSYNEKTGKCVLVRDVHADNGSIISPRVRHYWLVSPNVKRNEDTVKKWSKASVQYRVAFMGYAPNDPKHVSGLKFAGTQEPHILGIMPDDCILIARRHEGKRQVVAFGVVQGEHIKIKQLKGFKPPEEDGDSGSLRYLDPFITDYNEPPKSLIRVLPSRGRALRWLDPEKDAHKKICDWMELHLIDKEMRARPTIPLPRVVTNIQPVTAQITDQEAEGGHAVVTDEQFAERDEQRRRLGKLAQDVALQSERRRLRKLGHSNPGKVVRPVWDEPSRHYDILSCELDGSPRHIEVKSARKTEEKLSFFLSRYEWKESRTKPNYWFYLVLDSESSHPDVLMIAANDLSLDCLAPVNFLASIREPQS